MLKELNPKNLGHIWHMASRPIVLTMVICILHNTLFSRGQIFAILQYFDIRKHLILVREVS